MFILSNSYQLKDINNEIFTTIHDTKDPISFFISTGETQAFSVGTDLFLLSKKSTKKMADLKSEITCLSAQRDLACAGTQNGEVHIFSEHRTSIRQFKNHSAEITDIVITPSNLVITAAKDGKINFYDLIEGTQKHTIEMNRGYTRRVVAVGALIIAFSKDIVIYSSDNYALIKEIKFNEVIDHVIILSNEKLCFTCRNRAYLFDLETYKISYPTVLHTRGITMIKSYEDRIYTSSIDGHLKSFTNQLKPISDIRFALKIKSFAMHKGIPIVVSDNGKILSIEKKVDVVEQRKIRQTKPCYEDEIDYEVVQSSKKKLTAVDMMLRNFEYKGAVKSCIASNDISAGFAVLKYIYEKRQFLKVINDADLDFIKDLLSLCYETIKIQDFTPMIVELLTIMTSRYHDEIVNNEELKHITDNIGNSLNEIIAFEETYLKALSFVESFPQQ